MRILIAISLFLSSWFTFAQCEKCTSFEEAFKDPSMVRSIMINSWQSGVSLDSIPENIGVFENLEILYLSDHNFNSVPPSLADLKKLRELSFAGCQFTDVPEEIFQLTQLNELILLNNAFSSEKVMELKKRFAEEMPKTKVLINSGE
ncbi:MAG: hypothetical protein LPK47_08300 [Bacteroidota bacterium]|nr:hypothetical protein [Bacteroidota bacterium]